MASEADIMEHGHRLTYNGSRFNLIGNGGGTLDSTVSGPESGEVYVSLPSIGECAYADAFCLQVLDCSRYVEEALAATGDDGDWGPPKLGQIGRDVHA